MDFLRNFWQGLLELIGSGLAGLESVFEPVFGVHAWGWAIIGLTIVIRVLLLPLAVKQFRSMRAMQALQPEMARIKKKHKVDRDLLRKDPAAYREKRAKMNEEVMGLYREHGVNPAAGCLPLILQAPIFFALFRVLSDRELVLDGDRISQVPFYVFSPLGEAANASVWGWLLIALMVATMFLSQRQMLARTTLEGPQAQQQKIMMYVMPVFLAFIAQGLPIGVLLYWVTTNVWQVGQQAIMIREAKTHPDHSVLTSTNGRARGEGEKTSKKTKAAGRSASGRTPKGPDHLPRRGGRRS